jgi:hypothetical protein
MLIEAVNATRCDIQWRAIELRDDCAPSLASVVGPSGEVSIADFLQVEPQGSEQEYNVIITNPPYSVAMPMIEHSLEFGARFVVMLLRLNFLASESRAPFMRQYSPDVYVLPNRPSFSGHGTDSIDYAWFVWHGRQPRQQGKILVLPTTSVADRRPQRDKEMNSAVVEGSESLRT